MGGDFNTIRSRSERSNCVGLLTSSKAFNSFIDECKVVDLPFTGLGLNNKMSRLDRFFVDDYWLVCLKDLIQYGYGRSVSDHIPILLYNSLVDRGSRLFKLFNAWLNQEDCNKTIEEVWDRMRVENTKMISKLRRVKITLKNWNGKSSGSIGEKIKVIERKFLEWDDIGSSRKLKEVELNEVKRLNVELWDATKVRESVWCQKSRALWLKEGDANAAFFHKAVKVKAKKKSVYGLRFGSY